MVINFKFGLEIEEVHPFIFVVYNSPRGRFIVNCGWAEVYPFDRLLFPMIEKGYLFLQRDYPEQHLVPIFDNVSHQLDVLESYRAIGKWWQWRTAKGQLWSVHTPYELYLLCRYHAELPDILSVLDTHLQSTESNNTHSENVILDSYE